MSPLLVAIPIPTRSRFESGETAEDFQLAAVPSRQGLEVVLVGVIDFLLLAEEENHV